MKTVLRYVIELLEHYNFSREDISKISGDMLLDEDIGLHSEDVFELMVEIECDYNISIYEEEFRSVHTINDLQRLVDSKSLNNKCILPRMTILNQNEQWSTEI